MKYRIIALSICALFALAGSNSFADNHAKAAVAKVGQPAPDFTLVDAQGQKHSLSDFDGQFVVLEWINFDCPFVKKHYNTNNMQQLQSTYAEKEVAWLTICSSAEGKQGYLSGDNLAAAIKAHDVQSTAYLLDVDGTVGRMYQAKTTPNMYVINPDGVLIYAGAIDDRPSVKTEDVEGATNYVTAALNAAMAGKEVEVKATQPYGCSVKYAK